MNAPISAQKQDALFERNPLTRYLRLFQNQHRIISILYGGVLFSFLGFILLLSFLIFTVSGSNFIPLWGTITLVAIDLFLVFGMTKAFLELRRFKKRSKETLDDICDYLRSDYLDLESIKREHAYINQAHRNIQKRISALSITARKGVTEGHQGWDRQICPRCQAEVEMLTEVCPRCHHSLGKILAS